MGPRSWDRGELQKELERAPEDGASMGPRSWDRGELCETHYYRKRRTGFNGAAVLGPRRGNIPAACINPGGVASMGPRSWDRGEPSIVAIVSPETRVLQWGRGLGTAESGESASPERTRHCCFNGAAVSGPRRANVP